MPRIRHDSTRDLTEFARCKLECGEWFPEVLGGEIPDDDELAYLWDEHRGEILADHIAKHPGTRPWAWWRFGDAPEPRKRIAGTGPYPQYRRAASYGIPANCYPPEFETERGYLSRHGLLTPYERGH